MGGMHARVLGRKPHRITTIQPSRSNTLQRPRHGRNSHNLSLVRSPCRISLIFLSGPKHRPSSTLVTCCHVPHVAVRRVALFNFIRQQSRGAYRSGFVPTGYIAKASCTSRVHPPAIPLFLLASESVPCRRPSPLMATASAVMVPIPVSGPFRPNEHLHTILSVRGVSV